MPKLTIRYSDGVSERTITTAEDFPRGNNLTAAIMRVRERGFDGPSGHSWVVISPTAIRDVTISEK